MFQALERLPDLVHLVRRTMLLISFMHSLQHAFPTPASARLIRPDSFSFRFVTWQHVDRLLCPPSRSAPGGGRSRGREMVRLMRCSSPSASSATISSTVNFCECSLSIRTVGANRAWRRYSTLRVLPRRSVVTSSVPATTRLENLVDLGRAGRVLREELFLVENSNTIEHEPARRRHGLAPVDVHTK
jgi:hypothetical protein